MPNKPRKKWWRICRAIGRGIRFGLLILVLLGATMVLYCNEVGLPDFLKTRLVDNLKTRGIQLEFSRLRWRWYRGLVAENVRFAGADAQNNNNPQFSAKEVELKIRYLKQATEQKSHLQIDRFVLHKAEVYWPLSGLNQPPVSLAMTNIETQLRLLPGDRWQLDHFSGDFAGTQVQFAGSLTNATELKNWKIFHQQAGTTPGRLHQRLVEFAKIVERVKFPKSQTKPQLQLVINGDAKELPTFNGFLTIHAPGALTPWGNFDEGRLVLRLISPSSTNEPAQGEFRVEAEQIHTKWGSAYGFDLRLRGLGVENLEDVINAHLELSTGLFTTPWAGGASAEFTADWTHSPTNYVPLSGQGLLVARGLEMKEGKADEIRLGLHLNPAGTNPLPQINEAWGWWNDLTPYSLDWNALVSNISAPGVKVEKVSASGYWHVPEIAVTNLHTELYGGQFDADARLNITNRLLKFNAAANLDILKLVPLFPEKGQAWFANQEFVWEQAPMGHAQGSILLPAWTNRQPDWKQEVVPTLQLAGDFTAGVCSYRKIELNSAQSTFRFSNQVWNLPDLVLTLPSGKVNVLLIADDAAKDYYFKFHSTANLKALRPLAVPYPKVLKEIDGAQIGDTVIDGEIWGRWHDFDRLGARAFVTAKNVAYRYAKVDYLETGISYTNKFITLTKPKVFYTNEIATADGMGFDIPERRAYLTNGFGNYEPAMIVKTIGTKVAETMAPYQFSKAPTVHASGVIPLSDDISMADLHFQVDGGPFAWSKFHLPHVKGNIDWTDQNLTVRNLDGAFYGGRITGTADFDFRREEGADFRFDVLVTDTSMQELMADLTHTNHIEGRLNGRLNVTQANSHDMKSWFGNGQADLSDANIFEIPIFGILTPLLNAVSPNLGTSKASKAAATFTITNSIIHSDDLLITSPTVRLLYHGNVDFNLNVDATIEAQVGHETPIVGPLVASVLSPFWKLFETKVTGTLTNPKRQPVYFVAKVITPFVHPLKSLEDLFRIGSTKSDAPVQNDKDFPQVPEPLTPAPATPETKPQPAPEAKP